MENKKKQLNEDIPKFVHVSCFEISCVEVISHLDEKLNELSKNLKTIIAKRAKEGTAQIFNLHCVIKSKLNEDPDNIEKLVELKEYIANLPFELDKLKTEMGKVFDIFKTMEDFNYKFSNEDMNKKWNVFGGSKEIY